MSQLSLASVLSEQDEPIDVIECEDNLTFMRSFSDETMHLIVTSPPYNIGKPYERRDSLENYIAEQTKTIVEAVRLLHPKGSLCWQVGNYIDQGEVTPLDIVLHPVMQSLGLKLRNRIIWTFGHGLHGRRRLSGRYETIMWYTKSRDYVFNLDAIRVPSKYPNKRHYKGPQRGVVSSNPLGKNPSDVWDIPNVKANHVEKTVHPCQYPVELVERLVLALTNRGDNVLDPYLGVGSSALAALKNERNAFGCDIVPEYIAIAQERIHELRSGTLRTRPMDRPIYEPPDQGVQQDAGSVPTLAS